MLLRAAQASEVRPSQNPAFLPSWPSSFCHSRTGVERVHPDSQDNKIVIRQRLRSTYDIRQECVSGLPHPLWVFVLSPGLSPQTEIEPRQERWAWSHRCPEAAWCRPPRAGGHPPPSTRFLQILPRLLSWAVSQQVLSGGDGKVSPNSRFMGTFYTSWRGVEFETSGLCMYGPVCACVRGLGTSHCCFLMKK